MPFKLKVKALQGGASFEETYDQPSVLVGRDLQCDVVLQDVKSLVSREHAMIREKEEAYVLIDLESKNKTKLNQHTLRPEQAYPLEENDLIRIGDFELAISSIQMPVKVQKAEPQPESKAHPSVKQDAAKPKKGIEAVFSELNRVFVTHRDESREERKTHLLQVLRRAVDGLDPESAEKVLNRVETSFQGLAYEDQVITQVPEETQGALQDREADACREAYEGLLKIAGTYFDENDAVQTPEGVARLMQRMDQVMSVMFASLADALKGRRQFEQEFDVEATRILSWRFNPVKECDSGEKIGAYLFDWEKEPSIEQGITNLKEGFGDLALHHLGLIAGLNESLRGLLDQLLPDTFEVESQKPGAVSVWMRPFIRFEPFRSWAAWKQFRKKYKTLREEEVKTFETILGPYIVKGYLSVQKQKQNP
ncbi:hypothetical protein MNBD_NITROSPIRAE01-1402 [hydrothermal vent metagenome]|uniref:FHA domain-containing protein n=1 Tax=hydrothermal vent metagenome TaxID=652676 RepID=A0A3B1CQT4_9ZZZZ